MLKRRAAVSRSATTLAVWPDDDDATARAALRRELHRVAKALPETEGEPWILADQAELRWNDRANAWLDLDAFEAAISPGGRVQEAVALYRGDLLDGLEDEWIFAERERFRAANASALGKLLAAARSVHDYEGAIGYAGRILAEDPFREDIVRTLISVRYESGDRAGALHEAERYAKLYREELGVGLMPETEALRFAISRGDSDGSAGQTSSKADARQRQIRGFTPAFVGRAKEFESALALWHSAMRGVGSTLLLSGEAGIGKSRFIEELALVAERQGGRVLLGHTSAPERLPYEAISAALGNAVPLIASVRAEPAVRRSLERIVPSLAPMDRPPSAPDVTTDMEREQTRLFASLKHYISALARARPLLVVLEDIHWARPSTLAALQSIAESALRSRVLVVATLRTEAIGDALIAARQELFSRALATPLPLPRLAPEFTREIARSTARAKHLDDASIEELVQFSEGNPFYLIEGIVGYAAHGGAFSSEGTAIDDMITARVERMDEGVVDIASVAANIGDRFTLDSLRAVCGLDESVLLDGIGQLIEEHFLAETTGRTAFDYTFTHHLIRNAIYERIPAEKRRRRHRLIARVLEQDSVRSGASAIDIARHYEASGAKAEAAAWYRTAADFAVRSYANDEAAALLETALQLSTDAPGRFETLSARQLLRSRLGDALGEAEDFAAIAEIAESLDDEARFRVLQRRVHRALDIGNVADADAAIEALSEHPHFSDRHRVELAIVRTRLEIMRDRRDDAIAAARAGLGLVDEATPSVEAAELLCHLAFILFHRGEVEEGTALLGRAMSLSSSEDANASLIARTNLAAARKAYALQTFGECERFATASLEAAKIVGDREAIVEAFLLRASTLRAKRRLAEARADIDAALDRCRGLARGPLAARIALHSSMIDADSGELAHAEELCDAVIAEGASTSGLALVADAYGAKAFCRALVGDYPSARDAAEKALELFISVGNRIHEAYSLLNLGVIERELGNAQAGLDHIERSFKIQSPIFPTEELAATRSELALTCALTGDLDRARTLALDCVSVPVNGAGLAWQHLTFFTVWRTLRLTGNAEESDIVLRRACEAFALHYDMVPEESRERFLAIGLNVDLLDAADRNGIASSVRLPLRSL